MTPIIVHPPRREPEKPLTPEQERRLRAFVEEDLGRWADDEQRAAARPVWPWFAGMIVVAALLIWRLA